MTAPHDTPRTDERAGLSEAEADLLARGLYFNGVQKPRLAVEAIEDAVERIIADRLAAAEATIQAVRDALPETYCECGKDEFGRCHYCHLRAALTGDHLPQRDETTEYMVPFRRGDRLRVVDKGGSLLFKFPWEVGDFVTVRVCYPDTVDLVEDDGMVHWKTSHFQAAPEQDEETR